jgi:hypothetical protein
METLNRTRNQQQFKRHNSGLYKKQERRVTKAVKDEQIDNNARIVQTASHVQIFFKSKPSDEIRSELKRSYFKWYPRLACWQRFSGYHANNVAKEILKKYQTS